ncbi:STAS domain-containing protein [Mycolicibacterium sp. S3B2]|uniref:STAS domain-containing protein n=1 Tax=Mycolicibacterium sp. S3B2 TaxID=3415120 RepID=UPI003C7A67F0
MVEHGDIGIAAVTAPVGALMTMAGTLDERTYHEVRDSVIKAALEEPRAVLVDVTALSVPSESAWAAFSSARWHVSTWPDVPVVLVCAHQDGRDAITRSGAARYVPVHATAQSAARSVDDGVGFRRRAHCEVARNRSTLRRSRELVDEWLTQWDCREMILTASTVATIFVENVIDHTPTCPTLRLETTRGSLTVAVHDSSPRLPARREETADSACAISGLAIVAALSRAWGVIPVPAGKVVWAVLVPENRL